MITVLKLLITVAAFLSSWLALSQNRYDENLSPENTPNGLYYQNGPGTNKALSWDYPFGSKITINAGVYWNFELLTTNYPDWGLTLHQWSAGGNRWSSWRTVLVTDENNILGQSLDRSLAQLDVYREMRLSSINERDNVYLRINRGSSGSDRTLISLGQGNQYAWHVGLLYCRGTPNSDFYINQKSENRDGNGNFVHAPDFTISRNGNVGIGSISPDAKLMVVGDIHTSEERLDLNGTATLDYVFKQGYDLKSLKAVEDYIKEKGHLPNVPSAKEMEEEGVSVKEMTLKLLEKFEELTLYVIALKKENKLQHAEINRLKKQNEN